MDDYSFSDDNFTPTKIEKWLSQHFLFFRLRLRTADQRAMFRYQMYTTITSVAICAALALIVYLFFLSHLTYIVASLFVKSDNMWKYNPYLPTLEERSRETCRKLKLETPVTTLDYTKLRSVSHVLTKKELDTGRIENMNITLPDLFDAHARIMEENGLDCVCGPMYGVMINAMTFRRSPDALVNAVNVELRYPPSSVQRLNDLAVNREFYKTDNHHLIDVFHRKTTEERENKSRWYVSQDKTVPDKIKYEKKLLSVRGQPDFVNWSADQVYVVFPDQIMIKYAAPSTKMTPEHYLYDATCVEACIIMMQGNTLFDASIH